MGQEYELKYEATEAQQARIREALGPIWQEIAMATTYYDTPDRQLSARKWTLRLRLENGKHICTLKTPMGTARGEWETESETIEAAIPILCKLGCPRELLSLTAGGVVPISGAAFTRLAGQVRFGASRLELALDRGKLTAGPLEAPLCEVEVELKEGSAGDADRYAADLAKCYGLAELPTSKFKRALALRTEYEKTL